MIRGSIRSLGALTGLLACIAAAAQPPTAPSQPVTAALSPQLRETLREEMRSIEAALTGLLPHLVRGEWEPVAELAARIEGRFVLRQELSAEQRRELHEALPDGLLDLDRRFHVHAAELARAARNQNPELAAFWLYKLTDGCLQCHSRYAHGRFPGFSVGDGSVGHEHPAP